VILTIHILPLLDRWDLWSSSRVIIAGPVEISKVRQFPYFVYTESLFSRLPPSCIMNKINEIVKHEIVGDRDDGGIG
jgi:hypothetical protein